MIALITSILNFVVAPILGLINGWLAKRSANKIKVQGEVSNYEADATTSADTKLAISDMEIKLDKAYNDKFVIKSPDIKP